MSSDNDDLPVESRYDDGALMNLTSEERQWGMFCHLSSLLGLVFSAGILCFVGPLVCWLVKKDTSKFVDVHGKESLNFQINILIYTLIAWAITLATCGFAFPILFVPLIYGIVMPIIAGLKANEGKPYEYPYTFRLIK